MNGSQFMPQAEKVSLTFKFKVLANGKIIVESGASNTNPFFELFHIFSTFEFLKFIFRLHKIKQWKRLKQYCLLETCSRKGNLLFENVWGKSVVVMQPFECKVGKHFSSSIWIGGGESGNKNSYVFWFKSKIAESNVFVQTCQFFA